MRTIALKHLLAGTRVAIILAISMSGIFGSHPANAHGIIIDLLGSENEVFTRGGMSCDTSGAFDLSIHSADTSFGQGGVTLSLAGNGSRTVELYDAAGNLVDHGTSGFATIAFNGDTVLSAGGVNLHIALLESDERKISSSQPSVAYAVSPANFSTGEIVISVRGTLLTFNISLISATALGGGIIVTCEGTGFAELSIPITVQSDP